MSQPDKHRTKRLSQIVAVIFSAVIASLGVAGYQRTEDPLQLILFIGLAIVGYFLVIFLFRIVNRILDSLDKPKG